MKQKQGKPYKTPRAGEEGRCCIFCGRNNSIIRKYGLTICRQCFRERAKALGFYKYG
ncbi:MAG: 30S ribosomal protein S14 [archaeon]